VLEYTARQERRSQLFIRAITNGVLSERDRLLGYTVAEFYQEMSLFIEESEKRKAEFEKMRLKSR
jgi:hypothetical protein